MNFEMVYKKTTKSSCAGVDDLCGTLIEDLEKNEIDSIVVGGYEFRAYPYYGFHRGIQVEEWLMEKVGVETREFGKSISVSTEYERDFLVFDYDWDTLKRVLLELY